MLIDSDLAHFRECGWVIARPFEDRMCLRITEWVDEVQNWDDSGEWMHHREMTNQGPRLCRTENFVPFHPGLRALLTESPIASMAGQLLGEPAVLYKEKINYKLAGGAGFRPHQDAPAYPFVDRTVSVMVAVDSSTRENGCLEVVSARHERLLPMDERGCIVDDWVRTQEWTPVEMEPGDILYFDALTPHRSGPNTSGTDRRAIYPTYNPTSSGDLRDSYYAEKARIFGTTDHVSGTARISLINDFEGRPV